MRFCNGDYFAFQYRLISSNKWIEDRGSHELTMASIPYSLIVIGPVLQVLKLVIPKVPLERHVDIVLHACALVRQTVAVRTVANHLVDISWVAMIVRYKFCL